MLRGAALGGLGFGAPKEFPGAEKIGCFSGGSFPVSGCPSAGAISVITV